MSGGDWQPAATAPCDGRRIIAVWAHLPEPVVAWFSVQRGRGYVAGWRMSSSAASTIRMTMPPAAWLPIPARPSAVMLEAING